MKSTYKVFLKYEKGLYGWRDKLYLWDIEAEEAQTKRNATLLFDTGYKNFERAKEAIKDWLETTGKDFSLDFSLVSKSWTC